MNKIDKKHHIKTLMVIPARSGSKGIIDKNIRYLGELPLFCWTARAAELAHIEDALLILSTDSRKYARTGMDFGLTVPFIRPEEYASDCSSAFAAAQHAINWFKKEYGYQPEQIMWLQPTSPFRSPEIIQKGVHLMAQESPDAIIGCQSLHRDLTTLFTIEDSYLHPLSDAQTQTRRQDRSALLTPNGAFYLVKTDILLKNQSFYSQTTLPLPMDSIMSHDIDDPVDWQIAQAYMTAKLGWMGKPDYE